MKSSIDKLEILKKKATGYHADRILSQLQYGWKISKVNENKFDELICEAIDFVFSRYAAQGAITRDTVSQAEDIMSGLSPAAKKYKMICAAHAHIDMNWMWSFAETVAITLDTIRTILNLMNEYPEFTFSQSQASVYKIVEEYDPSMLKEISRRVREGRWEVTASTWVEADKNMPNGESLARHILYTKKYLAQLLDIEPNSLNLDFEPDTFGHSLNVPEILNNGGVKFYYHCRGYEKQSIYRWCSPSGSSVIAYREPFWYNAAISPSIVLHVPEFCRDHDIESVLKVYGVGDHGGGPTRKDIESIIDMGSWPIFPVIRFGTYAEFFSQLEKLSSRLPIEDKELNFIFTGCYTTQTRIKMANRVGEAKMHEAELFGALSKVYNDGQYRGAVLGEAWKKILFNQFHDILTGSGIIDTREYAMGQFQQVLAVANTETFNALRHIASKIDTRSIDPYEDQITGKSPAQKPGEVDMSTSEGAGAGYAIKDFGIPQTERGRGGTRIIHVFNSSPHDRHELVELVVWDWDIDIERISVFEASSRSKPDDPGINIKHQIIENDNTIYFGKKYWDHSYIRLLVDAVVPALGYNTYILAEKSIADIPPIKDHEPRIEKTGMYILENDCISVKFDSGNASIISLIDKSSGCDLVCESKPAGIFRLIREDDSKGMTSWIVGRHMDWQNLAKGIKFTSLNTDRSSLRQWIKYKMEFGNSSLDVTISLDAGKTSLDYRVECDWQEKPVKGKFVPQLGYFFPLSYNCESYMYDIPFGTIERQPLDMDVPANSWALALPVDSGSSQVKDPIDDPGKRAVLLISNTKHGFRGQKNSLSLTLIRSSFDPDPYPELGLHKFGFSLNVVDSRMKKHAIINDAYDYINPLCFVSGTIQKGTLPFTKGFFMVRSKSAVLSTVKMPEGENDGRKLIIRFFEADGHDREVSIEFGICIKSAHFVDINENIVPGVIHMSGSMIRFDMHKYGLVSVCVELGE